MMTITEKMRECVNELIEANGKGCEVHISQIRDLMVTKHKADERSVLPSDFCYNRVNNGIPEDKPCFFEHLGASYYRCLGENYPYNGPIFHKPKGSPEILVGMCVNGVRQIAPDNYSLQNNSMQATHKASSPQNSGHKTKREPNLSLRFDVLKKHNFSCKACGASPAKDNTVELHIDHIVPWSLGGETVIDNLQVLCSKCNLGKSNKNT